MVLVLVFIALVNLCLVLSYKHLDTAIRVENAYRLAKEADEGTVLALAAGLALLEVETPSTSPAEYRISFGDEPNELWYHVTFTLQSSVDNVQTWSVAATRTDFPDETFLLLRERLQELALGSPESPAEPSP